jgi:hypothetical protein
MPDAAGGLREGGPGDVLAVGRAADQLARVVPTGQVIVFTVGRHCWS